MQIRCKHYRVGKCKKDNRPCIFSEKCFEENEHPIKTNAERFRAMSDEELAAWARKQIGCGSEFFPCGVVCDGKCNSFDDETCQAKIKEWLKRPADE